MLQFGPLLFQLVVIVLEDLDQLLEIVNLVLVVQLDLVQLDSVVVGHVGHLPQSAVFSDEVLHLVRKGIDLSDELSIFLALNVLLLPQDIDSSDGVFCVNVSRVESKVFVEALNLVEEQLLIVGELGDGGIHNLLFLK